MDAWAFRAVALCSPALVAVAAPHSSAEPNFAISYPEDQKFGAPLRDQDFPGRRNRPTARAPASFGGPPISVPSNDPHDGGDFIETVSRFSDLGLTPRLFFTRIHAKDRATGGESLLLSNVNFGANFDWTQTWSLRTRTFLSVDLSKIGFEITDLNNIVGASQFYTQLLAGWRYSTSESTGFEIGGGVSQEVFFRVLPTSRVYFDKIMVPRFHSAFTWTLANLYPFAMGTTLTGNLLLPASAETRKISLGYGYCSKIFVTQSTDKETARWSGSLFYGQTFQNTATSEQTRQDVGLEIGLRWGGPSRD